MTFGAPMKGKKKVPKKSVKKSLCLPMSKKHGKKSDTPIEGELLDRKFQYNEAPVKWIPHSYQQRAIKFMLGQGAAGLFLDPGLGKTSISLAVIKILKSKDIIDKVLIIAPLRVVYSVWPEEIGKWEDFKHLRFSILHGKDKAKNLEADADIYLINPEGLAWLQTQRGWEFEMLIVDESSKFKNASTKRFKLMRTLVSKFNRRYILTGTPAPNGLMNLFGQIYLLDQGGSLGRYITHYRNTYFYSTGFGGYEWKLQEGAAEKIYEAVKPLVLRMAAEDYLDLPPLVLHTITVDLPDRVMKVYKNMENDLIANVKDNAIVAANAAVASQKCRQIANGGLYLDNVGSIEEFMKFVAGDLPSTTNIERRPNELAIEHLHDVKSEAVVDLIEQLEGQPALVAYEFKHDLIRLKKALGKDTPHIGGGVGPKKSELIKQAWNRGEIPVLLGQPSSMSHGLNMQGAGRAVIFHSMIWDFEAYDQFIKRVWRQGQTDRVFLYHIVARNTVDELILSVASMKGKKDRTQKALLDALKRK